MKKLTAIVSGVAAAILSSISAYADVSVAWTSPANGSVYSVGTAVNPFGQASASGVVGGSGLDLALVIDESGSMGGAGIVAAKAAAIALVNALPVNTSSVAVIGFDSVSHTYTLLTPLNPSIATVISAINGITAGGGTNIGSGIDAATAVLIGAGHTAGRTQQMVVLSDGVSSGTPATNAASAIAAGVDAIHSVGVPGHNVAQMRGIADGPDNIYGNSDDYGVYTSGSLDQLVGLFSGTSGNLVGIDHVKITLPDGTVIDPAAIDGLGNFNTNWSIHSGANVFTATAYDSVGNSQSATLTLYGASQNVPDSGATIALLAIGLLASFGFARRKLA